MITVACVLKSGGNVYDQECVYRLYNMVERNTTRSFHMVCLTDVLLYHDEIERIPLTDNLEGWWSKVELFKQHGPVVYLDLDTLIMANIDGLLSIPDTNNFFMLQPFNPREKWASGIMAWGQDLSRIHANFEHSDMKLEWDQRFISLAADNIGLDVTAVQSIQPGIVSWRDCNRKGSPRGTHIVCFHGPTKQHSCGWNWVKEIWR